MDVLVILETYSFWLTFTSYKLCNKPINMNYHNPKVSTRSKTIELTFKGKFTGKSFENETHEFVEKFLFFEKYGRLERSI